MELALLLGGICDARRMAIEEPLRDHVLSLFDGEDRRRAEEKYLLFRSKLIWYFDRHNCECPEDLADEALYRIESAVATGTEIYASKRRLVIFGQWRGTWAGKSGSTANPSPCKAING